MNQVLMGSQISLAIPPADLQSIQSAIGVLQTLLLPHLVDLEPGARRSFAAMGPKTVDFVSKTLVYTLANPQLIKAFVDVDEFQRDMAAVDTLRSLQGPLDAISHMVDSSLALSGGEAYAAALVCYKSFKAAAAQRLPAAIPISQDLSERFARMPTKDGTAAKETGAADAAAAAAVTAIGMSTEAKAGPGIKGSVAPLRELVELEMDMA